MCENCIYSTTCNLGIEDCDGFQDTDLYIEENKILFREEFFEMMGETEGSNYYDV